MRFPNTLLPLLLAPLATESYVVRLGVLPGRDGLTFHKNSVAMKVSSKALETTDCGCVTTTYSGNPSDTARSMNSRAIMNKSLVYNLNGEKTTIGDILGESQTSLVVFLRSLG